jgi:hypothetical protein
MFRNVLRPQLSGFGGLHGWFGPDGYYFPPFAGSRINWIESAQPKMPIVHVRKKSLDGRVPPALDPFTGCDDWFFRRR